MPEWLIIVIGVAGGITTVGGAVKMMASTFNNAVRSAMEPVLHEIRPNVDGSFRDEVNARLNDGDDQMRRIEAKVDALILNLLREHG